MEQNIRNLLSNGFFIGTFLIIVFLYIIATTVNYNATNNMAKAFKSKEHKERIIAFNGIILIIQMGLASSMLFTVLKYITL